MHRLLPSLQHGFARNLSWAIDSVEGGASPSVTLALTDSDYTRAMWDFAFKATFKVREREGGGGAREKGGGKEREERRKGVEERVRLQGGERERRVRVRKRGRGREKEREMEREREGEGDKERSRGRKVGKGDGTCRSHSLVCGGGCFALVLPHTL